MMRGRTWVNASGPCFGLVRRSSGSIPLTRPTGASAAGPWTPLPFPPHGGLYVARFSWQGRRNACAPIAPGSLSGSDLPFHGATVADPRPGAEPFSTTVPSSAVTLKRPDRSVLPTKPSQQPLWRSSLAESARPTIPPEGLLAEGPERPTRTRPDCPNYKKAGRCQLLIGDHGIGGSAIRKGGGVRKKRVPISKRTHRSGDSPALPRAISRVQV